MSGVNLETRSVTVEWYERGETKGKEVEIDAILALNPELNAGPRNHTPHLQSMPNKLARVSDIYAICSGILFCELTQVSYCLFLNGIMSRIVFIMFTNVKTLQDIITPHYLFIELNILH